MTGRHDRALDYGSHLAATRERAARALKRAQTLIARARALNERAYTLRFVELRCGWCGKTLRAVRNPVRISHGICEHCARQFNVTPPKR